MQMIFIQLSSPGHAPLRSLLIRYSITSSNVFIAVNVAVYIIWMAPKWEHAENLIRWLVVEKQILMCCKTSHMTRFLISDHVTHERGWCNSQSEQKVNQFSCSAHLVFFRSLNIRNMTIRHIPKCFLCTFTLCCAGCGQELLENYLWLIWFWCCWIAKDVIAVLLGGRRVCWLCCCLSQFLDAAWLGAARQVPDLPLLETEK